MIATEPPVPVNSPPARTRDKVDFADWLSPMLVKELRQGMRTRVFVLTFMLLQALMLLNVVLSLASASRSLATSGNTIVFWLMIAVPVVLVLPLSGLSAVSSEMKSNTLELIFLTRLSATRILFGKWFAIVAQTALFILAVLPYVVLRYFIGGVNLVDELLGLFFLLTISALFTAVTVGVSPYQTRLTRVLIWALIIFGLQALVPMMLFFAMGSGISRGGPVFDSANLLALPFLGASLVMLMLQIGAARIAPAAANHTATKRIIAVGQLAVAIGFALFASDSRAITIAAFVLSVPVLVGSVCETPRSIPSIYRPWVRRGFFGRLVGRFLYAGWPSGVPFTILLMLGFGWLMAWQGFFAGEREVAMFGAVCGAILFPAAVVRLLLPKTERALGIFIGIQALCVTLGIVSLIVEEILDFPFTDIFAFLPASAFVFAVSQNLSGASSMTTLVGVIVTTAASVVVLLVALPRAWRTILTLEKQSTGTGSDTVA